MNRPANQTPAAKSPGPGHLFCDAGRHRPQCGPVFQPRFPVIIRSYAPSDEAQVIALWRTSGLVYPQNDPTKDIARKLKVDPEWFLVGEEDGCVVGTVMVGYEGHRGWVNYLAVEPTQRRSGRGRALMAAAEDILRAEGCPKINLQVRTGNADALAFYQHLGFQTDDVISLGKRLETD